MEKNPNAVCNHRIMFNWEKILTVEAIAKVSAAKENIPTAQIDLTQPSFENNLMAEKR